MHKPTVLIFVLFAVVCLIAAVGQVFEMYAKGDPYDFHFGLLPEDFTPLRESDLRAMGQEVVPQLRELAKSDRARIIDLQVISFLARRNRPDADEFLLDLVSGDNRVDPDLVISDAFTACITQATGSRILGDVAFKRAAIKRVDSESSLLRGVVAELIGREQWLELLPKLHEMTHDVHLEVRERAAGSVWQLTQETVAIDRPTLEFPAVRLRESMFAGHRILSRDSAGTSEPSFYLDWFDGSPTRARVRGHELIALGPEDQEVDCDSLPHAPKKCFSVWLHKGAAQLFSVDAGEYELVSVQRDGSVLQQFTCNGEMAIPLYPQLGPIGLLVQGEAGGLCGNRFWGEELWRIQSSYSIYSLHSHRGAPDLFLLTIGSAARVYQFSEQQAERLINVNERDYFYEYGVLVPDAEGCDLAVFTAKDVYDGVPYLEAYDLAGEQLWSARLPSQVQALLLLEPTGAVRMIATVTRQGGIYLCDSAGTLLHAGQVPISAAAGDFQVLGASAGAESNGSWTLSVHTSQGTHLFELTP